MLDAVRIDPDAVYDNGALYLSLGIAEATLARARRNGAIRFTRKGHRVLYLGRWVLDWLDHARRADPDTHDADDLGKGGGHVR